MSCINTVLAALTIGLSAASIEGTTYNLRGPGPNVGDCVRSETVISLTDGNLNITTAAIQLAGRTELSFRNSMETTVLEMQDNAVTKVRIRMANDAREEMIEMMGQRNVTNADGPLHGQTIIGTREDGAWTFKLDNGSPTPQQDLRLQLMASEYRFFGHASAVYPDREVKVGESWEVDAADLHLNLSGAHRSSGKATYTLEKVEEVEGEPFAHLSVTLNYSADLIGDVPGSVVMKGEGTIVRSLNTFLDTSSDMTGTMEVRQTQENVELFKTGKLKMTSSESRP